MIVVLAILGGVMALTIVGVAAARDDADTRGVVTKIHTLLLEQRLRAMERSDPTTLTVTAEPEARAPEDLVVDLSGGGAPDEQRRIDAAGLRLATAEIETANWLSARFDAMGRTTEREWRFPRAGGAGGSGESKIWAILFDPVAGTPRLARLDP